MIALRQALTLTAIGDEEGYCLILEGLDDRGSPVHLRLAGFMADRLVSEYRLVLKEHERMAEPDQTD
jgi:hypothetical protein